jgi:hypothetical protein
MPADIDRIMAKFHMGWKQNIKGSNDAAFCAEFLAALPKSFAQHIEKTCQDIFEVRNKQRFRKRFVLVIATAYNNGMELQKAGHAFDIVKIMSRINLQGFDKLKKTRP